MIYFCFRHIPGRGPSAAGGHRGHGHEQEPGGPASATIATDEAVRAR